MIVPFVSRDTHQKLTTLVERRIRALDADADFPRLRHASMHGWTLDRLLRQRGLDITSLAALSHPILQIVMPDGLWSLNAARIKTSRIYWNDNRGVRRLAAVAEDFVGSADRRVAARVVAWNGVFDSQRIVGSQLPSQIVTSIRPHAFLVNVFARIFDSPGVTVWEELERRWGPKSAVSEDEKAQIDKEVRAPVRTWLAALGIPDRIRAEILRRERRPLVERWVDEVLA